MSSSTSTNTVQSTKSQLEDFLHRTNNAGLHVSEPSANGGGNWEVVDSEEVLREQDKDEWVLVGKTEAEKTEAELHAKARTKKRAKPLSQR
jgi:hypothetical protein